MTLILLILAALCFGLAVVFSERRIQVMALGLLAWVLASLIPAFPLHF